MRVLVRFLAVIVTGGLSLALGLALLGPEVRTLFTAARSAEDAKINLQPLFQRSLVYARDGSVIAVLHAEQNRQPVPLDRISSVLVDAIIDVEDERFWEHGGIDLRSTLRALYTNVQAGGVEQGGSTITQQLVKNTLLDPKRDAGRKVKEASLAVRLERQLSKREILERYLNTVYFGNGAYGVQAASERYFGVGADQVNAEQAALLAGLIRNPVGYDPFANPEAATARRTFALRRMSQHGHVGAGDVERLSQAPLPTASSPLPRGDGGFGYFVEEVKQQLLDDPRLGETPAERYNAVFNGGLQIFTTLDPGWERAAVESVGSILPDTGGRFTASLVTVDAATGAVRALVGGPGFEQAKYNLATQGRRQAGSAFKVFALVTAIEEGFSPRSSISGASPCSIPNPGGTPNPWKPENYEGTSGGTMSLSEATARSINCAYARLAVLLGIDEVANVAERMGITTKLEPTPAMTLGGLRNGVSPLEMASAYATLAAEGVYHEPYFIDRVLDREGKVVFEADIKGRRVLSTGVARVATEVLEGVVTRGTGTRARVSGRDIAGKTGTAQEYRDAWFVGYTPQLSTAVWMGAPVGEVEMRNVGGIRVTGGSYPARIWSAFMAKALADLDVERFEPPSSKDYGKVTSFRLKGERLPEPKRSTPPPTSATTVPDDDDDDGGDGGSPPTTAKSTPTTAKSPSTTAKPPSGAAPPSKPAKPAKPGGEGGTPEPEPGE